MNCLGSCNDLFYKSISKNAYLSLESLFRISSVGDGPDETIAVDHGVGALDSVTVSLLLAVLVVGVLVVVHVETELVGRVGLEDNGGFVNYNVQENLRV